jgi:hypothetical protein
MRRFAFGCGGMNMAVLLLTVCRACQDVFDALLQYMDTAPDYIFYDFACSLDEVSWFL